MIEVSVLSGVVIGISLPLALFGVERTLERKTEKKAKQNGRKIWWSLIPERKTRDFKTGEVLKTGTGVDFDPRHGHYMKCGETIITLSSASLVFIPTLHFSSTLPWVGLPLVLLGFTVVYALAFMGLLTYFYEMELQDPDSFTATRSCALFALGFGGLSCFAIAYFVLSILIGSALSHGAVISGGH